MCNDCNLCPHVSITEKDQCGTREDHFCNKYGKRVLHASTGMLRWHDPRLVPCEQCVKDNDKSVIEVLGMTELKGLPVVPDEVITCEYTMKEEINMEELSFAVAFDTLIREREGSMDRPSWNGKGMRVRIQYPDEYSKMTQPYFYMEKEDGTRVPWVPSTGDLFACDWRVSK